MGLFNKILGVAGIAAGAATGNPALAIGGISQLAAKDPKTSVPAADARSFLNYDISGIDPNFKYPAGYSPSTVRAPLYPTDLPQYTDIPLYTASAQDETMGEREARSALGDSKKLLAAALDPNSPLYKRLVESETQVSRGDFLRNLRDMQAANRKARSMGRPGLFGDERGDEDVARLLMDNARTSEQTARRSVLDRLSSGTSSLAQLAGRYGDLGGMERNRFRDYQGDLQTEFSQRRNDTLQNISTRRGDIKDRVDQQREDIRNMLNAATGQRQEMQANQADQEYRKSKNRADTISAVTNFLNMPLGTGGGGMSYNPLAGDRDLGRAMPWLS